MSLFKRITGIKTLISCAMTAALFWCSSAHAASLSSQITAAMGASSYVDRLNQVNEAITFADTIAGSDIESVYSAITKLFSDRITAYAESDASGSTAADNLNSIIAVLIQKDTMSSNSSYDNVIKSMNSMLSIETKIFSMGTSGFTTQTLSNIRLLLQQAGNLTTTTTVTFTDAIKKIFYTNLLKVFAQRVSSTSTGAVTIPTLTSLATVKAIFTTASNSPLVTDSSYKSQLATFIAIVDLESSILSATTISALGGLRTTITVPNETQRIFLARLKQLIDPIISTVTTTSVTVPTSITAQLSSCTDVVSVTTSPILDDSGKSSAVSHQARLQGQIMQSLSNYYSTASTLAITELETMRDILKNWYDNSSGGKLTETQRATIASWLNSLAGTILEKKINDLSTGGSGTGAGGDIAPEDTPSPLTPQLQSQIFALLQARYNGRTAAVAGLTGNDEKIKFLQDLVAYLTSWSRSGKLTSGQNSTINSTWVPTVNAEIAKLQLVKSGSVDIDAGPGAAFNPALDQNNPADVALSNMVFSQLKDRYDKRNSLSIDSLTSLRGLLELWSTPRKLIQTHHATIVGTWLPQIARELDLLTKIASADPKNPNGFPRPVAGQTLTAEQAKNVWDGLKKMYNGRDASNTAALQNLLDLIQSWLSSNQLRAVQDGGRFVNDIMRDDWIPTLQKEINKARIQDAITGKTGTDGAPASIDDLLDLDPSQVDEATRNSLFEALKKQYDSRTKTIDGLTKIKATITKAQSKALFTAEQKATMTTWTTQIDKELFTLAALAEIAAAERIGNIDARISSALNIVIKYAQSNLDLTVGDVSSALMRVLNSCFIGRQSTNEKQLTALLQLLRSASTSPLLNSASQDAVRTTYTPTVEGELANLSLVRRLNAVIAMKDYTSQLGEVNDILTTFRTARVAANIQGLFNTALNQVYTKRSKTDVDQLGILVTLLDSADAAEVGLLNESAKGVITSVSLPTVQGEINSLKFLARIRSAIAISDYNARLKEFSAILSDVAALAQVSATKTVMFSAEVQNLFARDGLVATFDAREGESLDTNRALLDVLDAASTSSLLSKAQQDYAKSMAITVRVEVMILAALALSDYNARIEAMLDIMAEFDDIVVVGNRLQTLFYNAVVQLVATRTEAYSLTSSSLDVVANLEFLLVSAEDTPLLSAAQRQIIPEYGDVIDIDKRISNALAAFGDQQLSLARNIVRIIPDSQRFDEITYGLFFKLVQAVYGDSDKSVKRSDSVITFLRSCINISILNAIQQQQVKQMLSDQGISIVESSIQREIFNALQVSDLKSQMTLLTSTAGKASTNKADQEAFIKALRDMAAKGKSASASDKAEIIRFISSAQTSSLGGSMSKQIESILLDLDPSRAAQGKGSSAPASTGGQQTSAPAAKKQEKQAKPAKGKTTTPASGTSKPQAPDSTTPTDTTTAKTGSKTGGEKKKSSNQNPNQQKSSPQVSSPSNDSGQQPSQAKDAKGSASSPGKKGGKGKQQQGVTTEDISALPTEPTADNIKAIKNAKGSVKDKVKKLQALVDKAATGALSPEEQNELADALADLAAQGQDMDPETIKTLSNIVKKAKKTGIIPPGKASTIDDIDSSLDEAIATGGKPKGAKSSGQAGTKGKTPTTPATPAENKKAQDDVKKADAAPTTEQIAILKNIIGKAKDKNLDAATKNAIAAQIDKMSKNIDKMSKDELIAFEQLLQDADDSGALSDAQKEYVNKTIKVKITKAKADADVIDTLPTEPTADNIKAIKNAKGSVKDKVKKLQALVDKAATGALSPEEQNELADALADLAAQGQDMDPETIKTLSNIVKKAKKTGIIPPGKASTIDDIDSSLDEAIATGGKPKGAKSSGQAGTKGKTPTTPATPAENKKAQDDVKKADAAPTTEQIAILKNIIGKAKDKNLDAATKNAIAAQIDKMSKNIDKMSKDELIAFEQLLQDADDSGALSDAQKEYVNKTIKVKITKAKADADVIDTLPTEPTADNIKAIKNAKGSVKDKVKKLQALVDKAATGALSPEEQNELADALADLAAQGQDMDPETIKTLSNIVKKAKKTGIIPPGKASTIDDIDSSLDEAIATGGKPKGAKSSGQAGTAAKVSQADIDDINNETDPVVKKQKIKDLIKRAGTGVIDADVQKSFSTLLETIVKDNLGADAGSLSELNEIIQKATNTGLLNKDQKVSLSSKVTPLINEALRQASEPTAENIKKTQDSATPQNKLTALETFINKLGGKVPDAATQAALDELLASVIADESDLTIEEKKRLGGLIKKARGQKIITTKGLAGLTDTDINDLSAGNQPRSGGLIKEEETEPTPGNISKMKKTTNKSRRIKLLKGMGQKLKAPLAGKEKQEVVDALNDTIRSVKTLSASDRDELLATIDILVATGTLSASEAAAMKAEITKAGPAQQAPQKPTDPVWEEIDALTKLLNAPNASSLSPEEKAQIETRINALSKQLKQGDLAKVNAVMQVIKTAQTKNVISKETATSTTAAIQPLARPSATQAISAVRSAPKVVDEQSQRPVSRRVVKIDTSAAKPSRAAGVSTSAVIMQGLTDNISKIKRAQTADDIIKATQGLATWAVAKGLDANAQAIASKALSETIERIKTVDTKRLAELKKIISDAAQKTKLISADQAKTLATQ